MVRLSITCHECAKDRKGEFLADCWFVPLSDTGVYRSTCPVGHSTVTILQQMRFEVLAEAALQAILDGYTREAVSSFAASLERFQEFYCQAVLLTRGVDGAQVLKGWKAVKSQSERQLGMFAGLFLLEEKVPAPLLKQQASTAASMEFRNRVVHQGYIPTVDEAVAFGQAVIDIVEAALALMRPRYAEAIDGILQYHYALARAGLRPDEQAGVSFMFQPMVYRLVPDDRGRFDLMAELATRRARSGLRLSPSSAARHG